MIFVAGDELLPAERLVLPMKTTCTAAKLIEVSIVQSCAAEIESEARTYAALAAKISAGRAGVDSARATEKTKERPIAVNIRAMRLWMK